MTRTERVARAIEPLTDAEAEAALVAVAETFDRLGCCPVAMIDEKADEGVSFSLHFSTERARKLVAALTAIDEERDALSSGSTSLRSPEPSSTVSALSGNDPARGGCYRKRPVEVEAFQWVGQDRNDWPEWAAEDDRLEDICAVLIGCAAVGLKVWTLEGAMRASHGDWIIKGIGGELYPCKPDIFAQTYEAIATETRRAETENTGSVEDEGAGRRHRPNPIGQEER